MTQVRFLHAGDVRTVDVRGEERLLDIAQREGLPLEGTCGGDMACATCHVIVAPGDFAQLGPAGEEEEDMLDMVPGSVRTSRLACQIVVSAAWDSLTVTVPD